MSPELLANAIRILSIDAVEKAQSGHPGMPLGMADIACVLWQRFLRHNPKNPNWFNRDRFVLSNGHGSMLYYALLHFTGYNLSLEEIQRFRQLHSKTPGHPEYGETPGIETTTGPLGQGLANAVGMALAEKILAATFNQPGYSLVDHYTYAFVGDGCLMEGISHEACSFAGTWGLSKLIVFYDDNDISIDGDVAQWFGDDTAARFHAYHWHVVGPIDGMDQAAVEEAIHEARNQTDKPTLIICKTIIGYASPVAGSEKSHGSPLGSEGVAAVRKKLNWHFPAFVMPEGVYEAFDRKDQGCQDENAWIALCHAYQQQYPDLYARFLQQINGDLPDIWDDAMQHMIDTCLHETKPLATRKCSEICLETLGKILPGLLGGSADLTSSNNTFWSGSKPITHDDASGNYIHYGVREFGMAGIMNGIALHGGFIPYGGTFLVFLDYARNAVRLSALMKQRVIYVFTHDSIGLGEDGPTHQPIEHAAMLRYTPNIEVWRPADLLETAIAWQQAVRRHHGPSALLLTRQNIPQLPHVAEQAALIARGGYILADCEGQPDAIIIATGSEVHLALRVYETSKAISNRKLRVVSMPCCERFLMQEPRYQQLVLPCEVRRRVAVEAARGDYWYRFVGLDGKVVSVDTFGVSAKAADAFEYFKMTETDLMHVLEVLFGE